MSSDKFVSRLRVIKKACPDLRLSLDLPVGGTFILSFNIDVCVVKIATMALERKLIALRLVSLRLTRHRNIEIETPILHDFRNQYAK